MKVVGFFKVQTLPRARNKRKQINITSNIKFKEYIKMKFEKMTLTEIKVFLQSKNIDTNKKSKQELIDLAYKNESKDISYAIGNGSDLDLIKIKIKEIANSYSENLKFKIKARKVEMEKDDNSHYLIYRVLGISNKEGQLIDQYQNTGRFLYKYAGSFLEEVSVLCLFFSNLKGGRTLIPNTIGKKPKNFEIDFLNGNDAIELKWRDATTDGDHITKEHTRVKSISEQGYNPVRVMFYYPQREQAIKIQSTLKTLYAGIGGEYYAGDDAWDYIYNITGYDLKSILIEIAEDNGV